MATSDEELDALQARAERALKELEHSIEEAEQALLESGAMRETMGLPDGAQADLFAGLSPGSAEMLREAIARDSEALLNSIGKPADPPAAAAKPRAFKRFA